MTESGENDAEGRSEELVRPCVPLLHSAIRCVRVVVDVVIVREDSAEGPRHSDHTGVEDWGEEKRTEEAVVEVEKGPRRKD